MGVLFLPPSNAYVRSVLYLFYSLIKVYYTKLWVIKPRLWPQIEFSSGGQESRRLFVVQQQPFIGPPRMDRSRGRVLTKHGPLEKAMANHFSISASRTPWTLWKAKNIWHWKMNFPGWEVPNMLLEESGEITPERVKEWSQSENNAQLWMWLVMEGKSDAVKNNIA